MKLFDILFKETIGDLYGAESFAGGPFGIGGNLQLAKPNPLKSLVDPAEEEENKVSGHLDNWYKYPPSNRTMPTPGKAHMSLKELKLKDLLFIAERNESDMMFRDLPGWPRMNTLAQKRNFVPPGEGENQIDPDLQRIPLIPGMVGKNSNKDAWYGTGPLNVNPLTQNPTPEKADDLNLVKQGAESVSSYKVSKPENRGILTIKTNDLVDKQQFVPKPHGEDDDPMVHHLNDPGDVPSRPGTMSYLTNPKQNVPDGNIKTKLNRPTAFVSLADVIGTNSRQNKPKPT
jgi:hypothetical protein